MSALKRGLVSGGPPASRLTGTFQDPQSKYYHVASNIMKLQATAATA